MSTCNPGSTDLQYLPVVTGQTPPFGTPKQTKWALGIKVWLWPALVLVVHRRLKKLEQVDYRKRLVSRMGYAPEAADILRECMRKRALERLDRMSAKFWIERRRCDVENIVDEAKVFSDAGSLWEWQAHLGMPFTMKLKFSASPDGSSFQAVPTRKLLEAPTGRMRFAIHEQFYEEQQPETAPSRSSRGCLVPWRLGWPPALVEGTLLDCPEQALVAVVEAPSACTLHDGAVPWVGLRLDRRAVIPKYGGLSLWQVVEAAGLGKYGLTLIWRAADVLPPRQPIRLSRKTPSRR
jgi:hypothetical protein